VRPNAQADQRADLAEHLDHRQQRWRRWQRAVQQGLGLVMHGPSWFKLEVEAVVNGVSGFNEVSGFKA